MHTETNNCCDHDHFSYFLPVLTSISLFLCHQDVADEAQGGGSNHKCLRRSQNTNQVLEDMKIIVHRSQFLIDEHCKFKDEDLKRCAKNREKGELLFL